jgi:uncharacterized protein YbjQ (UPF0145 family)
MDVLALVTITLGVLTTTTQHIQGRPVREYLGIVSGECLINLYPGQGKARTTMAGYKRHRRALQQSIDRAIQMMALRASNLGATVVVSVAMEYLPVDTGSVLVIATGTAVRL